jgi:hypothetical protein
MTRWALVNAIRRRKMAEHFRECGDLYGDGYDEQACELMRLECEERGIPMRERRLDRAPRNYGWDVIAKRHTRSSPTTAGRDPGSIRRA